MITFSKRNDAYLIFNSDAMKLEFLSNSAFVDFNEKKYEILLKENNGAPIYTVLGEVYNNIAYNDMLGYLVGNSNGELDIYTPGQLLRLLKNNPCLNYSIAKNSNKEYVRKNPNVVIPKLESSDVRDSFNLSFQMMHLREEMSVKELEYCMNKWGFKLGFKKVYNNISTYLYKSCMYVYSVYYNDDGSQIIFNLLSGKNPYEYSLRYYHQTLKMVRKVDSVKYHEYLHKNPYNSCSTSPIGNPDSDKNVVLFSNSDIYRFESVLNHVNEYSKRSAPYFYMPDYLTHIFDYFNTDIIQASKVKDFIAKYEGKLDRNQSLDLLLYLDYVVGYKNLMNYDDGLKKYYRDIINNEKEFFEGLRKCYNISRKMQKEISEFLVTV